MSLFDVIELRQPPEDFLQKLDRRLFSIPRRWDTAIGEETLDLLEHLRTGLFIQCRKWKGVRWRSYSLPKMTWDQIAELFNLCAEYILRLEKCGTYFRNPKERYTLKQFMVQEWKDPENPWSVFLLCCFGTDDPKKRNIQCSDKVKNYILSMKQKTITVQDTEFTISDSIFEEE